MLLCSGMKLHTGKYCTWQQRPGTLHPNITSLLEPALLQGVHGVRPKGSLFSAVPAMQRGQLSSRAAGEGGWCRCSLQAMLPSSWPDEKWDPPSLCFTHSAIRQSEGTVMTRRMAGPDLKMHHYILSLVQRTNKHTHLWPLPEREELS